MASLAERLETAFGAARRANACAWEKQKLYHDATARHSSYAVGKLVWLPNPAEGRKKLAPHWKGPYRVLEVLGSVGDPGLTYRIALPLDPGGQGQVVHYDRLKPYTLPLPPATLSGSSPPLVPSGRDNRLFRWGRMTMEPCRSGGGDAESSTDCEPLAGLSRFGRTVRQPCHLKDFVSYQ